MVNLCCLYSFFKILKATPAGRPAGRHTFVRQQKYAKVPFSLRRASLLPGFRLFKNLH